MTMQKRRVVVTGMGMITPLGIGVEKSWKALCAGESGIARITKFDRTDCPSQIAEEVKGFNPDDFIESKEVKKMDTFLSIRDGIIPPTINLETPDPKCDLNYSPLQALKQNVTIALSNAFGFGGVNASLVFRKYREREE